MIAHIQTSALSVFEICGSSKTYDSIKFYLQLLAPAITIFSGLLGLFTQTKAKRYVEENGRRRKVEYFTKAAWWSLSGLILGLSCSIWLVINDKYLGDIQACKIRYSDSTGKAKADTANARLERANSTLFKVVGLANSTTKKMDSAYGKQLEGLKKQDQLADKTEYILHPLTPITIRLNFYITFSQSTLSLLKVATNKLNQSKGKVPMYFDVSETGEIHANEYSLMKADESSNAYEEFQSFLLSNLLPRFDMYLYDKLLTRGSSFSEKSQVYQVSGITPSLIGSKTFAYSSEYWLKYDLYPDQRLIKFTITIKDKTPNIFGFSLKSLYEIKNGSLSLEFNTGGPLSDKKIDLRYLSVLCGAQAAERYDIDFSKVETIGRRYDKMYFRSIKKILSLSDGTANMLFEN